MKTFKVLGTGCKNCIQTADLIAEKAQQMGVEVSIEKVTDIETIMEYGVMSTPGVVLEGKVIHSGGLPSGSKIMTWLAM